MDHDNTRPEGHVRPYSHTASEQLTYYINKKIFQDPTYLYIYN